MSVKRPKDRLAHSRVTFESDAGATDAISKLTGLVVGENSIIVSIFEQRPKAVKSRKPAGTASEAPVAAASVPAVEAPKAANSKAPRRRGPRKNKKSADDSKADAVVAAAPKAAAPKAAAPKAAAESKPVNPAEVYVGGLPDCSEDDIKALFAGFTIVKVERRNKAAFVTLRSVEDATAAIAKSASAQINGVAVRVEARRSNASRATKVRRERTTSKKVRKPTNTDPLKVWVGGLSVGYDVGKVL